MERQISVTLYHRDHFSSGRNRQIFGYQAYHWGIMIIPQGDEPSSSRRYEVYDATDASELNMKTWRMNNPSMDWWFRVRTEADHEQHTAKLLGHVVIGALPPDMSHMDLEEFYARVPLPTKNTEPQQSCVSWVTDAILALQQDGLVPRFDIDAFKDRAVEYADKRHNGQEHRDRITYTESREPMG